MQRLFCVFVALSYLSLVTYAQCHHLLLMTLVSRAGNPLVGYPRAN